MVVGASAINWVIVGPILTGLAGALGAYLAAARRMSGKIATSDAADLWRESRAIRNDCRDQLLKANVRIEVLEARVVQLEDSNAVLKVRVADLLDELRRERA